VTSPASTLLLKTPAPSRKLLRATWDETTWTPHDAQQDILFDRTRNKVVAFGRRAGKSQIGGKRLTPEYFRALLEIEELTKRGLRREYWIVGPEYSDAEKEFRVVWNDFETLGVQLDKPGSYNNPEAGQMRIQALGGKFIIHAKSAKYPGTLVGEGLSGVVFSEAAKLKPSVWIKYIRPTLADFGGWTYFGSTPEGRNWFYDLWEMGQDPTRADWRSWTAPSWVNPYVYPDGVDIRMLKSAQDARRKNLLDKWIARVETYPNDRDLPPSPIGIDPEIWSLFLDQSTEMFNQEIWALFNEFSGRVFKDWDEELHVTDQEFRPDWETYACSDYGFTNPFVWLLIQMDPHHERVHVLDEYYEVGKTTSEAAAEIHSRGLAPRTIRQFFPDPAEPDRTREISELLQLKPGRGTGILLSDRIEWIRRFIKPGLGSLGSGEVRMTVHRRCRNTIREMGIWKYPETAEKAADRGRSAPENPEKKDDHTPEALGRFFSGMFGSPYRGARSRQSTVKVNK
jgi:hypothetical protein